MKFSKRETILVLVLLVIVSATVLYLYVWQPLWAKGSALQVEINQLETTIGRLTPWESREQELNDEINNLKRKITAATEQRELGIPLPQFLVLLEGAARTTGITLENTSLHISEIGGISTMNLFGSYQSIYRFLSMLQDQDEALVLEALQFTGEGTALKGILRVRLFSGAIIGEPKEGGYPSRSPFIPRR